MPLSVFIKVLRFIQIILMSLLLIQSIILLFCLTALSNHLHLWCLAAPKSQKPKLLKPQPRKIVLVSISREGEFIELIWTWQWYHCHYLFILSTPISQPKIVEENLTYAELDLVKPIPDATAKHSGTVYAQILFEEQQLWEQIFIFFFSKKKKLKQQNTENKLYLCFVLLYT